MKTGSRLFTKQLQCQEIREFNKPARRPTLPADYTVSTNQFNVDKENTKRIRTKDSAWAVTRLDLSNIYEGTIQMDCQNQTMPSWSAFNSVVTSEILSEKSVGFLPVITSPVTEYSTLYTAMKKFQGILGQLKQNQIAVTCDEGVYHIARAIKMISGDEFSNATLCLGSFHMAKVLIGCIGKYVRNSGAESIWTENSVFGQHVVQSVIARSHYARSVKSHLLCNDYNGLSSSNTNAWRHIRMSCRYC